jgi:hypothetical protein
MWLSSASLKIHPLIVSSQPLLINMLYLPFFIPILIFLALILLFTIIVVVKLTILSKGPLRPFSSHYV